MSYKNILELQTKEFNGLYREINKNFPYKSVAEKRNHAYATMLKMRGLSGEDFDRVVFNSLQDSKKFQYQVEAAVMYNELFGGGVPRYYINDESLFDFFKNTEVKPKEVLAILDSEWLKKSSNFFSCGGILGKTQAYTIVVQDSIQDAGNLHIVSILTNDMNYSFCIEQFDSKSKKNSEKLWVFNLAMNFLFYITAFPECVVDGVPNGVKKQDKAKSVGISEKVVSHRTVEHGFVRPHFRSGYFRHLTSDYFVNCKGQVRFIESTMVKGRAKTVISKK